jgi:hypothetical protein
VYDAASDRSHHAILRIFGSLLTRNCARGFYRMIERSGSLKKSFLFLSLRIAGLVFDLYLVGGGLRDGKT